MTFALIATALAWVTVVVGIVLAILEVARRRVPRWLLWFHPGVAVATLVCAWWAVAILPGPPDLSFNSGALVLTLAFVIGAALYALRRMHTPPVILVIALHAAVAIPGAALVTIGMMHVTA